MSLDNDRSAELRGAILRGVFEENRGAAPKPQLASLTKTMALGKALSWLLLAGLVLSFPGLVDPASYVVWEPDSRPVVSAPPAPPEDPQLAFEYPSDRWSEALAVTMPSELQQPWGLQPSWEVPGEEINGEQSPDYGLLLENSNVRLTSLFGLAVKTIVIDPGHGGRDPGAIGDSGTMEKDLALDIALRLRDRLQKTGIYRVAMTRETDETISLSQRAQFANEEKADLFISLHINSLPQKPLNVIETYYFGPSADVETLRLAEKENQGSEYPLGGFKEILQKIGDTIKHQESATFARFIQRSLYTNIRKYDPDVHDVGAKIAPFVVLLGVDSPSALAEISCITNDEEEAKLSSSEYREKIASFLEQGIINYLSRRQMHAQGEGHHEPKSGT